MSAARDPAPSTRPGVAHAHLKHLREMGDFSQPEPDVAIVVTRAGRRLKWLRIFGGDLWKLCSTEEPV